MCALVCVCVCVSMLALVFIHIWIYGLKHRYNILGCVNRVLYTTQLVDWRKDKGESGNGTVYHAMVGDWSKTHWFHEH